MMRPQVNKYQNPYIPAADWHVTALGPVMMDTVLTIRDTLPIVRRLHGTVNADNTTYELERNWARRNPELAELFFTEEYLTETDRTMLGY